MTKIQDGVIKRSKLAPTLQESPLSLLIVTLVLHWPENELKYKYNLMDLDSIILVYGFNYPRKVATHP